MQVLFSLIPHDLRVILNGGLGTIACVKAAIPLVVEGLTVDSKLTIVVPLWLQVIISLIILVVFVILHSNYSSERRDRDEFNVLLLNLAIKFSGSRSSRREATRAPHKVFLVIPLHRIGPQFMLSKGSLKWLQSILDPANTLYDFLVNKVLSLQASVEFRGSYHTGHVLILLRLIE